MMSSFRLAGKRCLVTGASSFIGSKLCEVLNTHGIEVYGLVRKSSPSLQDLSKMLGERCIVGSLESIDKVFQSLNYVDVVFHLAWSGIGATGRSDQAIQAFNFSQSMNVLCQARYYGCTLFVFGGSQAEYGNHQGNLITELSECRPVSEYGKAKLRFTNAGLEYTQNTKMRCLMARIFSVYGPRDHDWTLISTLIRAMRQREIVPITSCTQSWNFLYVDDAVNALIALATDECDSGVYNIASTVTQPLKAYINVLHKHFPGSPAPGFGMIDQGKALELRPSVEKLLRETSWRESFTFEQGVRQTIQSQ